MLQPIDTIVKEKFIVRIYFKEILGLSIYTVLPFTKDTDKPIHNLSKEFHSSKDAIGYAETL